MRGLLGLFCLWLFTAVADAATVTLKSGEHGEFTRIVFYLPEPWDWRLRQDGREVSVLLPGRAYDLADETVYERISRERIGDIRKGPDGDRIDLLLNCECVATTFEVSPRIIVVDIAAGAPPVIEEPARTSAFPGSDWIEDVLAPAESRPSPQVQVKDAPEIIDYTQGTFAGIVDAIMQKTSEGYLSPQERAGNPEPDEALIAQIVPNLQTDPSEMLGKDTYRASAGLRIAATRHMVRFDCGARLRPPDPEESFVSEIASLRMHLITQSGEVSGDIAEQMARSYVYYGLPQEARAILTLADDAVREMFETSLDFLDVDGWDRGKPPELAIACEALGEVAEATLSEVSNTRYASPDEFLTRFKALSPHLRDLIGPRMSAVLRTQRKNDLADKLDGYLLHVQPEPGSASDVLRQNTFEEVTLELETASAAVADPGGHGGHDTAKTAAAPGHGPGDAVPDASLMQTFLKEYDGALPDDTLAKLLISVRTEERKYKAAVSEIRDAEALSARDRRNLLSEVVGAAAAQGGVVEFLELAFYLAADEIAALSAERREEVRARLLDLGFDDKAALFDSDHGAAGEHAEASGQTN